MHLHELIQPSVEKIIQQCIININKSRYANELNWVVEPLTNIKIKLPVLTITDLRTFFKTILEKNPIGGNNPELNLFLDNLFEKYTEMENLLLIIDKNHKEHFYHLFRVFIIGLLFYVNVKLPKTDIYPSNRSLGVNREIYLWSFVAFFHDFGYGIEKLELMTEIASKVYKGIGTVDKPNFTFDRSNRTIIEHLILKNFDDKTNLFLMHVEDQFFDLISSIEDQFKRMNPQSDIDITVRSNRIVDPIIKWNYRKEKELIIERSAIFWKSMDENKHGLISASQFLKICLTFSQWKEETNIWRKCFIPAAIAMAFHSVDFKFLHKNFRISIDDHLQDPIFPSFLLGLIDTFEYMDRFSLSNEKPIIKPFDRKFLVDINLQNTFDKKIYKKFFTGVKKPYYVIKCNYLILEDNKGNKRIKESELTDIIREYASKRLVNLSRCFMFSERFSILVILFIEGKLKFKIVFFGELPSKEKLAKTDVLKW